MPPRSFSLSLAVVIAAAGCDDGASPYFGAARRARRDAATFYVNNGSEPEYLDPGKCSDLGCAALVTQLFEGLTRYHPEDARPAQGVASRWEKSDDNRLYRFHLRPEARWSDGRPVTAGDFAYAWRRVLHPATASRAAGNLTPLLNGDLFRRGLLVALRDSRSACPQGSASTCNHALLAEPHAGAPERARLPAGTVVHVLERAKGWAQVERWTRLPTYGSGPAPLGRAEGSPPPRGWVPEGDLVEDDSVVGVRATSDLTLEVELERPTPYFLDLTSHHALSPVRRDVIEAAARRGEEDLWTRPESLVGNGPYALDRWDFQYQITMKANPFHWERDRLRIARIVWFEVQDYHAAMNLYKTGELDALGDNVPPPAEYQERLATKKDYRRNEALAIYWYELNTKRPPLDDARVRRALDLAIDKKQIVARVTRGGQAEAAHYVPDITGGGYAEQIAGERSAGGDPFAEYAFDPEAARAALTAAGYGPVREGGAWRTPGFPALEIAYNTGEGHRQIAIAVQAMWREHLGISASLRSLEWKVLLKASRDGDFQVMRSGQTADYNHPNTFLESFGAGHPQNHTGWQSDAFDGALAQAAEAASPAESMARYRAAEKIALAGMARIPLYFYTRSTLVKPWVMGFRGTRRNPHAIQFLWIDPASAGGAAPPPAPPQPSHDTFAYVPPDLPPPGPFAP